MSRMWQAVCAALVVGVLAGCTASTQPAAPSSPGGVASSTAESPTTSPSVGPSPSAGPSGSGTRNPSGLATAPTAKRSTLAAVKPSETASVQPDVLVSMVSWEPVQITAGAPGEIAGDGVGVTIRVTNNSPEALDLTNVVADLRYGKGRTPAPRSERSPTQAFSGELAPGESAEATYAFLLDKAQRDRVRLLLSLNPEVPVVVFSGSLT